VRGGTLRERRGIASASLVLGFLFVVVVTSACCRTRLLARPLKLDSAIPQDGWDYSLPFVRYDITLVRVVTACKDGELTVAITAKAAPSFERDPAETYTLDYRSLSALTKLSDLQIEKHPNGMLKRIGAASEDRTGPILVHTATAIANIARAVATSGVGYGIQAGELAPERPACSEAVELGLREVSRLRPGLDAATAALEEATAALKALVAVVASLANRPDTATQRALVARADSVVSRQIELDAVASLYASALDTISDSQNVFWPETGAERSTINEIRPSALERWTTPASLDRFAVILALQATNRLSAPAARKPPKSYELGPLRYRVPVKGRLVWFALPDPTKPQDVALDVLAEGPVPQLGRTYLLPLENGLFQNNALSATFSEDGNLVSAGYAEKTSVTEEVSEAVAKIAAALPQTVKDVRLAGAQMEADELDAEARVLDAKVRLQKARDALEPASTRDSEQARALLVADTALKEAERANIAATFALDRARSDPFNAK
jgi:hypothetical protein